jgi:hypothetical protein
MVAASSAFAGSSDYRVPPPASYDHAPLTTAPYVVRDIDKHCAAFASDGRKAVACSGIVGAICFIFIEPGLAGRDYELVYRHEIAHCNGWPADHPR